MSRVVRRLAYLCSFRALALFIAAGIVSACAPKFNFVPSGTQVLKSGGDIWSACDVSTNPIAIYRSVGPGNTSALAIGTSNAVTISGVQATFASALPDNVGVGDAIQYQVSGSWQIAFITCRASSQAYELETATGDTPTSATDNMSWSVFRAYTSLADVLGDGPIENTGINDAVRSFESWTNGRDLVANNEQWNIALYADAVDTTQVMMNSGFNTSATNYMRVYTPYLSTDVGVSQRHTGVWSSSGYRLVVSYMPSECYALSSSTQNIWFDGLQVEADDPAPCGGLYFSINCEPTVATGWCKISNNIVRSLTNAGDSWVGISFNYWNSTPSTAYIWNNLVYGFGAGAGGMSINVGDGQSYVYNNTAIQNQYGFFMDFNYTTDMAYVKNNIVQGTTQSFAIEGEHEVSGDYNIFSDSHTTGGSHDQANTTVTYLDTSVNDYRLSPTDTHAIDAGESLADDPELPFDVDMDQFARPMGFGWDIGPNEIPTSSNDVTMVTTLTFPSSTSTSFTAQLDFVGDANSNNSSTMYYCDASASPGCNPLSGSSVPATRSAGSFSASASGLVSGHTINVMFVTTDPDGISGGEISSSIAL